MARLSKVSIADLQKELAKKQGHVERLTADREKLLAKLAKVDRELALVLGGQSVAATPAPARKARVARTRQTPPRRGRRPKLTDAMRKVLADAKGPLDAAGIAAALKRGKFKTKSKNLSNLVREALSRIPEVTRASRGKYVIKG